MPWPWRCSRSRWRASRLNAAGWQKNGHSTDGKGIDHFFDVYGETLVGALFAALANA